MYIQASRLQVLTMGPQRTSRAWRQTSLIAHLSIKTFATILLLAVWPSLEASFTLAQVATTITPTSGLGSLGTTVTRHGQTVQITGGSRPDNDTNLFHSFDQFTVGPSDTAQFLNTTPSLPTSNILGRVTGVNPSHIFGTIDAGSYPGANLFLMNPAGIVFGPDAALNVSGSVAFTTADYLRIAGANGSHAGIFHADRTATSLLTSASIAAFGFLKANPAAIEVRQGTTLTLQPGQSISFIGGSITIEAGTLVDHINPLSSSASGNQVYVAGIASPGEILPTTLGPAANINGESPELFGEVRISQGSKIDTSNNEGGAIRIRGGRLVIDDSNIFAGSGGISFDATSISIKNSARIGTYTTSTANAGNITLKATRDIEMDSDAGVESQTFTPSKDAGNIAFRSGQGNVKLTNGAFVTSQTLTGGRNSGSIEIVSENGDIRLENSSLIYPSADEGTGKIGSVTLIADNLELIKDSHIDSDNFSTQTAGPVEVRLSGILRLTGSSQIQTTTTGTPPAADLLIKAREVRITGGSQISAETTGTSSTATGGSITVNATDQVTLANGGSITASSVIDPKTPNSGIANAGNIKINAGQQLEMRDNSSITTTTQSKLANGGNIDIRAIDRIRLVNSTISTSVKGDAGSGGNIFIDPNVVILQGSKVTTEAVGGAGGNITFVTPLFLMDSASTVSARSQHGVSGTVTIQSPTSNLSGTVGQLASKTNPPQVLLQNRCIALAGGEQSTFILAGRDALPSEPGGWLSSPVAMEHWTGEETEEHVTGLMVRNYGWNNQPLLVMSKDETTVLSLRRLTPPGFLVRSFAVSAATGCSS